MSSNENGPEIGDELGRELHRRADELPDSPLSLGDVRARAGSIRRTRRLATAAGVAAVAVILPVAVFAGNGLDRADAPGPATTSPSATRSPSGTPTRATDPNTPSPTETPAAGELRTYSLNGDLTAGSPPALPWLDGDQLLRHDQDPVALPRAYDQFVMLGDTVFGVYGDERGNRRLESSSYTSGGFDTVGDTVDHGPIVDSVVVNDAGSTLAWTTLGGTVETAWSDGGVRLADGLGPLSPAAVVGDGSCHEEEGGCRVLVNGPDYGDAPRTVDSHGIVDEIAPGSIDVADVSSTGLVALMTSSSDTGSCSGVYDEALGGYLWKTCKHSFLEFSPDGGLLLATGAYGDGFGLTFVTVLDSATGDPRVRFEIDRGAILQAAWEDEEHLLAVTYDDAGGWRILRLGLDGTRQVVATPAEPANQDERPLFLPGRS